MILFSTIIAIIGFTAFGFINKSENVELRNSNTNPVTVTPSDSVKTYFELEISNLKKAPVKQKISYMVRGFTKQGFYRPITQEKIKKAKSLSDIIENYPSSWISDYNSVIITATINGKEYEAKGLDATLTSKQKELFNSASISSNILINVHYQKKNYNDQIQNRQMNVSLIVTPKIEAEYINGYEQMITYFEKNSMNKIQAKNFKLLPQASISFTINKNGNPESILIDSSYGDTEIDNMLVKLVQSMPKWNPAKNAKGLTVKQKFVLDIGPDGC